MNKIFSNSVSLVIFAILVFSLCASDLFAQAFDANRPPNEYRSKGNPLYWKNKMPVAGYWQQDVYYKIDATIDEDSSIITGRETLKYWNNSPDTLAYVYFHLYQNMTLKGGPQANLVKSNHVKQKFGKYEEQGLGCKVNSIKSGGVELKTEWDYTLIKVYLPKALLPNDSAEFEIGFKTYWDNGSERRRFKKLNSWGYVQYDGVHWYPRICVYDRKFGWDTNQHLGKEFYGNFGTYDVSLNFANDFIVEATGTLQNETEVMPDSLRKKLDIKNFANKPWNSEPSVIIKYVKGERKVWKYYAENVHDFSFTADPTYRIGETVWNGIRVIAMCREPHCAGWRTVSQFGAAVVKTYSEDFGMYGWPKLVMCDAEDGMEYNMLNLDGGWEPNNYDLIAHEAGHEWFYGMVANNETYRASLDEGFTQFIESWCLEKLTGKYMPDGFQKKGYYNHFKDSLLVRDGEVYLGYMNDAIKNADESINQHSDMFNSALGHGGGYRHVYYKTATMLWNLQYVLGDSLFNAAMKHYFNQWKFAHPYFEDFRNSFIQFTHADLNWFFDQWMETTKNIDYKVCSVKKAKGVPAMYEITFKRKARMQMPVDFSVETKDGKTQQYTLPNTWFAKSTDASVLPKWYGWDKLNETYTATITADSKIKNVTIDPSNRLADIYMPDNTWKCSTKWRFDSQISNTDWKHYVVKWRPDVWYNAVDGIKAGIHLEGDFMKWRHVFDLNVWANTRLLQNKTFNYGFEEVAYEAAAPVSFTFSYKDNIRAFPKYVNWNLNARYLDGLLKGTIGLEMVTGTKDVFTIYFQALDRPTTFMVKTTELKDKAAYPLYLNEWLLDEWNNTLNFDWKHTFTYRGGSSVLKTNLRNASLYNSTNYSWLNATLVNRNKFWKFDIDTRIFAQYATGKLPSESSLWLSGNNPEGLIDDKFTRSVGFFPSEWTQLGSSINHFQDGGGLNLRGYAGYLAPEKDEATNEVYTSYKGNSGAAINIEIQFDRLWNFSPSFLRNTFKLEPYFFADAGSISVKRKSGDQQFQPVRADGGLGCLLTVKRFFKLEEVKAFTIRADFPLLVTALPYEESNYFDFRWMIGIGKSF